MKKTEQRPKETPSPKTRTRKRTTTLPMPQPAQIRGTGPRTPKNKK